MNPLDYTTNKDQMKNEMKIREAVDFDRF